MNLITLVATTTGTEIEKTEFIPEDMVTIPNAQREPSGRYPLQLEIGKGKVIVSLLGREIKSKVRIVTAARRTAEGKVVFPSGGREIECRTWSFLA